MENIQTFNKVLGAFNIGAACVNYQQVDNYSYYDLILKPNAKVKDLQRYSDEISLALKTASKPSIKIMHNLGVVRLEFVEPRKSTLKLFDYFTNSNLPKAELLCLLGQGVSGNRVWMDLVANPHMIIAGTTGSGKSTLLHNIIANLFNYSNVKLYLVDPKNIEFSEYEKKFTNNLKVYYSYNEALNLLDRMVETMEYRYDCIRKGTPVENFPYLVIMIDEFADLIMQDRESQFHDKLCRLAQKCRAARIHIILSTQRPSVNIVNGTIKANFPARIACRVPSHIDSKVILDSVGAETLLGKGDALLKDNFRHLERFQVAYTDAKEICAMFGE
jgi:S-DNA-T family DNA segregation ATPase FtsK/SpoIIIE